MATQSPGVQKTDFAQLASTIKNLKETQDIDTLLGSMKTTEGILVLLFSHRFNREVPLLIPGTELERVVEKVTELL